MHSISNVDERFSKDRSNTLYKMDDVLQLQCVGEVEYVNSSPTKVHTFFFVHTTFKLFFSRKNASCLVVKFILNEDLNSILFELRLILLSYFVLMSHCPVTRMCYSFEILTSSLNLWFYVYQKLNIP